MKCAAQHFAIGAKHLRLGTFHFKHALPTLSVRLAACLLQLFSLYDILCSNGLMVKACGRSIYKFV